MTLVSVIVPSIGSGGVVLGGRRTFVVEAVRSVLATAQRRHRGRGRRRPRDAVVGDGRALRPRVAGSNHRLHRGLQLLGRRQPRRGTCDGEYLLLLNDDTEVISDGWLTSMLDACGPGVGAVGAKLLFEDGTLQHAGHTYRTALGHVGFGLPGDSAGRNGVLLHRREVAGVTAACMLTPLAVFDDVGGFTVQLPGNYNDVDYCMKLRVAGWSSVYEPAAVLYHFESKSRVAGIRPEEVELIQRRWLTHLVHDRFTPGIV